MTLSILTIVVVGLTGSSDKVLLARLYEGNSKSSYAFSSRLDMEFRQYPFQNFFPVRNLTTYSFTFDVERQKPDGVADLRFKRPQIVVDVSESPWGDAEKQTIDMKDNVLFTLSRANQILAIKDESPPRTDKKDGLWIRTAGAAGFAQLEIVGNYVQQLFQLSGFVNFFDFGPTLPARPIEIGDTWKETKAYAPITVKAGADKGKNLVSRLDYEYTYKGDTEWEGKTVTWIQGKLVQDSDAAAYVAELYGYEPAAFPVTSIKLKLEMDVDYYLDKATLWPLRIRGTSEGHAAISIKGVNGPVEEIKMKGQASLSKK